LYPGPDTVPSSTMFNSSEPTLRPMAHSASMDSSPSMKSASLLCPKLSCAKIPAAIGERTTGIRPPSTGLESRTKEAASSSLSSRTGTRSGRSANVPAPTWHFSRSRDSPCATSNAATRRTVWRSNSRSAPRLDRNVFLLLLSM